jgi:hypothetical protein
MMATTPQQPTSKGGPAFPSALHPGMTLRDHFAGIAWRELVAEAAKAAPALAGTLSAALAEDAYTLADAMLVERMKKREGDEPPGPKLAA